jgi:hypothetical protein
LTEDVLRCFAAFDAIKSSSSSFSSFAFLRALASLRLCAPPFLPSARPFPIGRFQAKLHGRERRHKISPQRAVRALAFAACIFE